MGDKTLLCSSKYFRGFSLVGLFGTVISETSSKRVCKKIGYPIEFGFERLCCRLIVVNGVI